MRAAATCGSSGKPERLAPCDRCPTTGADTRSTAIDRLVWAMKAPHRKRVHSYNIPGHAHELTFSCLRQLPLLSRDRTRRWFVDAMEDACREHVLALWAYVIMPEHVHVLLWPRQPAYEVRLIRTALKVSVQRKALKFLRQRAPAFLDRLKDVQPNGKVYYRFLATRRWLRSECDGTRHAHSYDRVHPQQPGTSRAG